MPDRKNFHLSVDSIDDRRTRGWNPLLESYLEHAESLRRGQRVRVDESQAGRVFQAPGQRAEFNSGLFGRTGNR